jgi:hypothetical protein
MDRRGLYKAGLVKTSHRRFCHDHNGDHELLYCLLDCIDFLYNTTYISMRFPRFEFSL